MDRDKSCLRVKGAWFGAGVALAILPGLLAAQANRDNISIVGSSTVYPFTTVVAEQFGRATDFRTPTVESTGSGGGLKLFCSGVGVPVSGHRQLIATYPRFGTQRLCIKRCRQRC